MLPLRLLHLPKGSPLPAPPARTGPGPSLEFSTCQRQIWIDLQGALGTPSHEGEGAYAFLLEVICGLHSRVFGETEVLGQFKTFIQSHPELAPWSGWLLEDAKSIRSRWLRDVGAQSYGSVVRRWCSGRQSVTIIGTGQFATKLAPWLPQASLIRSRNLEQLPQADAYVIAAPLDDRELTRLKAELQTPAQKSPLWIDLRGERGAFNSEANHTLDDLYCEIERDSRQRQSLLPAIRAEIERLACSRLDRSWHRPQGWEDLS